LQAKLQNLQRKAKLQLTNSRQSSVNYYL